MLCPVCNGIRTLEVECSLCGVTMSDSGRIHDFTGPYAPYQPIEDEVVPISASGGDAIICTHIANCPVCEKRVEVSVTQWESGTLR
ncbi:hypothetical protein [Paenibacillus abyssi]|uniref:Uncharacterized protein n=1 Tax=Paenibacillus abyssi TaxID=1340531 RepID=A0A917FRM4_9BACL|nr:hypothetical protein [Paenibacillus abyssi]GGF96894.1 hypothetical protein GCM10010916_12680 [Paenibacillus abyssi]